MGNAGAYAAELADLQLIKTTPQSHHTSNYTRLTAKKAGGGLFYAQHTFWDLL